MAYRKYTLLDLKREFGVTNQLITLFKNKTISPVEASDNLKRDLKIARKIQPKSEKAKSELIVSRVLIDLMDKNDDFFTIYSGDNLPADTEKGLNGEIDFILAYNTQSFSINTPLISVVEAKRGEMDIGVNQCAAQMYGAKIFNDKANNSIPVIYGCVTNANEWLFLKLENNTIFVDKDRYSIRQLSQLLGIWQFIIDFYKKSLVIKAT